MDTSQKFRERRSHHYEENTLISVELFNLSNREVVRVHCTTPCTPPGHVYSAVRRRKKIILDSRKILQFFFSLSFLSFFCALVFVVLSCWRSTFGLVVAIWKLLTLLIAIRPPHHHHWHTLHHHSNESVYFISHKDAKKTNISSRVSVHIIIDTTKTQQLYEAAIHISVSIYIERIQKKNNTTTEI